MLLGKFQGGGLRVDNGNKLIDKKQTWHKFNANNYHWTENFKGERYSITVYLWKHFDPDNDEIQVPKSKL